VTRPVRHSSAKAGLPPGEIVHVGGEAVLHPGLSVIDYDGRRCERKELSSVDAAAPYRETPSVTWINVEGVGDPALLGRIGKLYDLHPLTLEDIANTHQRPKAEDYGHYVFVVLRMLGLDAESGEVRSSQVSLVLGRSYVISFREGAEDVFDPVRERIVSSKGRMRASGADYLLYALMDAVIDGYFAVLERLGERMEALERRLLGEPEQKDLHAIQGMKRDIVALRRSIWPLREVTASLARDSSDLVTENTRLYLRDVHDHAMRLVDHVETNRDALSGLLDIYLSNVSNRMNAVMKVLTIIATIFIPLSFFAGVYGMNFKSIPELEWRYGYYAWWGAMAAAVLGMFAYFRRKRWL
jgi:magnesium transporter